MGKGMRIAGLVCAVWLTACGSQAPTQPPMGQRTDTAVQGSIAPVEPVPGLHEIGLDKATVSVETLPDAWAETKHGITTVTDAEGADVVVTQYDWDGAQRWQHTVGKPRSDDNLRPRVSVDEVLGIVAVWFTTAAGSQTAAISGDIRWFDLQDGKGDTIRPERTDERSKVESWNNLVGYLSYSDSFAPSTSFTFLGPDREPQTLSWSDLLEREEQSWLTAVQGGVASYSVISPDGSMRLQHGNTVVLEGGGSSMRWMRLSGGIYAATGIPGSKLVVVDEEGTVLFDYAGECSTSGDLAGQDGILWAGSLMFDSRTGQSHCLTGLNDSASSTLGLTASGIALGRSSDGMMVFSEPSYVTARQSKVPIRLQSRGGYVLAVDDRDDERTVLSAFNADDLSLR
ncbi:hypothetical protein [uncultured Tessaracoccus sp.]|uniref:hypothetical protein n=1 Tax=uncultured Tessaracoccus sp. TaxID=905023 RepID=UPI0026250816|nr:hypothetical protein [uncultured Tessaracoccus sp.]